MQTAKSKVAAAVEAKGFAGIAADIRECGKIYDGCAEIVALFSGDKVESLKAENAYSTAAMISAFVIGGKDLFRVVWSNDMLARHDIAGAIPQEKLLGIGAYDAMHTAPILDKSGIVEYINASGKLAKIKLGKFLRKFAAHLSEKARHHLALEWRKTYAPDLSLLELIPANAPDEWLAAFSEGGENGANSCMAKASGWVCPAVAGYACADLLPPDLAALQMDIALAIYRNDDGNICARAIVNTSTMEYFPVYGKYAFERQLAAAGFTPSNSILDGYYIHAGDNWEMSPYLDGHHCADSVTIGGRDFWRVSAGGKHALTRVDGGSALTVECPCCREQVADLPYHIHFEDNDGTLVHDTVCLSCWENAVTTYNGDECLERDTTRAFGGEVLIENFRWAEENGFIYSDWHDCYMRADDAYFSEYYSAFIHYSECIFICDENGDCIDTLPRYDIRHAEESENGLIYYSSHYQYMNNYLLELGRHISQMPENQNDEAGE